MDRIRNFSIIAHVDHGKSTLADRLIQLCGGLTEREMEDQVLDSMDLERERGITIKAQSVALTYKARDGLEYNLNLIDTPGHVDFSYEVSRSLAACDGALLVVDAGQGVEAQSVANCYTATELGLEVVPVINKIDLPTADPENVIIQIEDIIGIEAKDALRISAKTGLGVDELLERIVERIPPPKGSETAPLQALIVDSWFDSYAGVVSLVRMVNGVVRKGSKILVHSTNRKYEVETARRVHAAPGRARRAARRRSRISDRGDPRNRRRARRRHDSRREVAGHACAAGLQEDSAARVRGLVSARLRGLRELSRGAPEARVERLVSHVRARGQRRARLRHALRVSWGCCTWRSSRSGSSASTICR